MSKKENVTLLFGIRIYDDKSFKICLDNEINFNQGFYGFVVVLELQRIIFSLSEDKCTCIYDDKVHLQNVFLIIKSICYITVC